MNHLLFIIWLLLYPITLSVSDYIEAQRDRVIGKYTEYSPGVKFIASTIVLVIYITVAILIY